MNKFISCLVLTRLHVKIGTMFVLRACLQTVMLVKHSSIVHKEQVSSLLLFSITFYIMFIKSHFEDHNNIYVCMYSVL